MSHSSEQQTQTLDRQDGKRKRRGGLLPLLLLLGLLLAVAALVLPSVLDSDKPDAGGGTVRAGQSQIEPGAANALAPLAGQQAEGRGVTVQEVIPNEGFFIGESAEKRVYVEYGGAVGESEATVQVQQGQRVNVFGPVDELPENPAEELRLPPAGAETVRQAGGFINADTVEPLGPPGAGGGEGPVAQGTQSAFDDLASFVPKLLGALAILLIGFLIARAVKGLIAALLAKTGVDRMLKTGPAGRYVEQASPDAKPSKLIGAIAFWGIFLVALTIALGALGIPAVTEFVNSVLAYLPKAIAALLIVILAGAIAGAVGGLAHRTMGDTPTGRVARAVGPALVLGIGAFMALNQLEIAQEIVTITYAALMGATALALALAFGLGGQRVARDLLNDAYDKGQENVDQAKDDLRTGRDRAQDRASEARERVGV